MGKVQYHVRLINPNLKPKTLVVTVQKLVGHASPVTTAKYDRRGEETKRRAVQKLGF